MHNPPGAVTASRIGALTDPGSLGVDAVAFSPDGRVLATADHNGRIYPWNVATRRRAATLTDPGSDGVASAAFSPGGRTLATSDQNGSTYLWTWPPATSRRRWPAGLRRCGLSRIRPPGHDAGHRRPERQRLLVGAGKQQDRHAARPRRQQLGVLRRVQPERQDPGHRQPGRHHLSMEHHRSVTLLTGGGPNMPVESRGRRCESQAIGPAAASVGGPVTSRDLLPLDRGLDVDAERIGQAWRPEPRQPGSTGRCCGPAGGGSEARSPRLRVKFAAEFRPSVPPLLNTPVPVFLSATVPFRSVCQFG